MTSLKMINRRNSKVLFNRIVIFLLFLSIRKLIRDVLTLIRNSEESAFISGSKVIPDMTTTTKSDFIISPSRCEQHNDSRKRFLMRKQVSEDVCKTTPTQMPKTVKHDSNIVFGKYSDPIRSLRNSQEVNNESDCVLPYDFKRYSFQIYMLTK